MMVAKHDLATPDILTLKVPLVGIFAGDVVSVVRGCRRNFKQCQFYMRESSFMAFDIMPSNNPFSGVL